jgi:hypothetical protein
MHDTADKIIYAALGVLLLMGLIAFWINPAYEKGVWIVLAAANSALTGALGFKFGITNSKDALPLGSTTDTTTKQTTETPAVK